LAKRLASERRKSVLSHPGGNQAKSFNRFKRGGKGPKKIQETEWEGGGQVALGTKASPAGIAGHKTGGVSLKSERKDTEDGARGEGGGKQSKEELAKGGNQAVDDSLGCGNGGQIPQDSKTAKGEVSPRLVEKIRDMGRCRKKNCRARRETVGVLITLGEQLSRSPVWLEACARPRKC